jgi:serine/threonine protein kinase/regulation of enolase protein 1 (concanavalin A-like superfamily)
MSVLDPGSEPQFLGRLASLEAGDRAKTPQPDGAPVGTAPEATAEYPNKDGVSPAEDGAERGASRKGHDWLDPPRTPGELGWLAHYRVRRCIGEGGMGLVFEAEDTDLLRSVALKVIRPELVGIPQVAQRFLREARAMAALKHDHIVTIYQVGQQRGAPYLAMEYLRGMSLHRWLERGHKPSVDLVLRLGRELAAGLTAAHRRGLIHRDIKPANIWLEAPIGRVKILDFGLARTQSHDVKITDPGSAVGTPAYMAPEQARGEGDGASCDLFSLGCVLYELCTGRLPFPGTTVIAVLTSLSMDTPPRPRELNPALPPALEELIMRLLAKQPADRPPSAQAVVEAIKGIERELLTERQRAELSMATPLPAAADSTRQAPVGIAGEPGTPHLAAKARNHRRALGFAAALAVLGMSVAGADLVLFSRTARTVASAPPAPIAVAANSPSRAALEPSPPSSPSPPIASPQTARPPAEAQEKVSEATRREQVGEATREEQIGKATREATSPRGGPRPEVAEKSGARDSLKQFAVLGEGSHVIDPNGDCRILLDKAENRATILVPGATHLLSADIGRTNAPRILRDIRGEFEVRVKVTGTTHPGGRGTTTQYAPYHGAGILLWQDTENYVRLEIAADVRKGKIFPYANFELRQAGLLATSRGLKIDDGTSYLRLQRRGDQIHGAFSLDGDHWTPFPPMVAKLEDRVEVGVVAVNSSSKPLTAEFEGFAISEGPGASGDVRTGAINP